MYEPLPTPACQRFRRGRRQGAHVLYVWLHILSESPCPLLG